MVEWNKILIAVSEFLFKIYHCVFLCRAKYIAYDMAVLVTNSLMDWSTHTSVKVGLSELEMERNSPSSMILISVMS